MRHRIGCHDIFVEWKKENSFSTNVTWQLLQATQMPFFWGYWWWIFVFASYAIKVHKERVPWPPSCAPISHPTHKVPHKRQLGCSWKKSQLRSWIWIEIQSFECFLWSGPLNSTHLLTFNTWQPYNLGAIFLQMKMLRDRGIQLPA